MVIFGLEQTGGGLIHFNGVRFSTYTHADGLGADLIRDIQTDASGKLYIATDGAGVRVADVSQIPNSRLTFQPLNLQHSMNGDEQVRTILLDKYGVLWIGTNNNGLLSYHKGQTTRLNDQQGLPDTRIRCLLMDHLDNLWVGTQGGGLVCWSKQHRISNQYNFEILDIKNKLGANSIRCLNLDSNKRIWVGFSEDGLAVIDQSKSEKIIRRIDITNGLINNSVRTFQCDNSGNMWIGTEGGGISVYRGDAFQHFSKARGIIQHAIWGIEETSSNILLLGTDGAGVNMIELNHPDYPVTNYTVKTGLPSNQVICLKQSSNEDLWLGTLESGACRIRDNQLITIDKSDGLRSNMVLAILEDRNNNIWLGLSGGGLCRIELSTGGVPLRMVNYTEAQGLSNQDIICMMESKDGYLWFGTNGGGIFRLKKNQRATENSYFEQISSVNGLNRDVINCLLEGDNNTILVGTENGICAIEFTDTSKRTYHTRVINSGHGLPDNLITNIIQLPNDKIAVGTNKGIAIFDDEMKMDASGKLTDIMVYNESNGFPIHDVNGQGSLYLDSKGTLWAGTGYDRIGLVRFDYKDIRKSSTKPVVVINQVSLQEQAINWYQIASTASAGKWVVDSTIIMQQEMMRFGNIQSAEKQRKLTNMLAGVTFDSIQPFYPLPVNLTIPYEQNQISFEFNCLELSRHNMVNYQYKLEGYQKDWSPLLKKEEATFGNMREGSYTFYVKAQSPDGIWSDAASFSFTVLPPWYRTWWAIILFLTSVFMTIVLLVRWRTNALKHQRIHLQELVKSRTAEVEAEKREVEKQKEETDKQFKRSEELLLNILPAGIAEELKTKGEVKAKQYKDVTVLFTDFTNFTGISAQLSPQDLVSEVHECYTAFDLIMEKHKLEKIKTIGDAYLAVCGLPNPDKDHALHAIEAAKDIIAYIEEHKQKGGLFDIRIGLDSGTVVAGIVGVKKFAYDIWSDTVNTAARMEQHSEPGKINISGNTFDIVKDKIPCTYRGKIDAKNKGEVDMYFVST